jgi:hypothetical protein
MTVPVAAMHQPPPQSHPLPHPLAGNLWLQQRQGLSGEEQHQPAQGNMGRAAVGVTEQPRPQSAPDFTSCGWWEETPCACNEAEEGAVAGMTQEST